MTVDEAREAYNAAAKSRQDLDRERENKRRSLVMQVEADLHAEYDARMRELVSNEAKAKAAYDDAIVADSEAKLANFPTGVVYEWKAEQDRWSRILSEPKLTGRKGRYDLRRRDTVFPANAKYSLPRVGEVFIRVLKKDGTPGSLFVFPDHWREGKWLPEGETP